MIREPNNHRNPLVRTFIRGLVEFLISIPFALGFFLGMYRLGCATVHGCDDFKGLGVGVIVFVTSIALWGIFLTLYGSCRKRPKVRIYVIAIGALVVIAVWIIPLFV